MPIRANIAKGFLLRLGIVALVASGFALWALYDGTIGYPQQRERALVYQELSGEDELMDEDEQTKWDEVATENGWPLDDPGPPKTKYDFAMQYFMSAMAAPFGLLFLYFVLRNWGRWIEATETGLNTSWKQAFSFGQIESLDKKHWKKKGIAKVTYGEGGRKRRLVLDDFKYDFELTKEILLAVESHIDSEQIVDGVPESLSVDQPAEPVADAPAESAVQDDAI